MSRIKPQALFLKPNTILSKNVKDIIPRAKRLTSVIPPTSDCWIVKEMKKSDNIDSQLEDTVASPTKINICTYNRSISTSIFVRKDR